MAVEFEKYTDEQGLINLKFLHPEGNSFNLIIRNKIKITEELISKLSEMSNEVSNYRGKLLTLAIEMEQEINELIKRIIFNHAGKETPFEIKKSEELIDNLFLKNNSLTLMARWKILRTLISSEKILDKKENKNFLRRVHELIDVRNIFAHGKLIFKNEGIYISFFKNGINENLLDKNYFEEVIKSYTGSISEMQDLQQPKNYKFNV
jgi:hypothetical protein